MDDIKPVVHRPIVGRTPRPRVSIPISHDATNLEAISSNPVKRVAPTVAPVAPAPQPTPAPVVSSPPVQHDLPVTSTSTPEPFVPPSSESDTPQVPDAVLSKTEDPQPEAPAEVAGQVSQAPSNQTAKKSHLGAVLIAFLVALALVAGAGYAYMQNQKETTKTTPAVDTKAVPETKTPTVAPATTKDIDDTTEAIDNSLKTVDDTTDASESDLSDSTLGL